MMCLIGLISGTGSIILSIIVIFLMFSGFGRGSTIAMAFILAIIFSVPASGVEFCGL